LSLVELRATLLDVVSVFRSELDVAYYFGRGTEYWLSALNSEVADYAITDVTDQIDKAFLGVRRWLEST